MAPLPRLLCYLISINGTDPLFHKGWLGTRRRHRPSRIDTRGSQSSFQDSSPKPLSGCLWSAQFRLLHFFKMPIVFLLPSDSILKPLTARILFGWVPTYLSRVTSTVLWHKHIIMSILQMRKLRHRVMKPLARFMQKAGDSWDLNLRHLESEPGLLDVPQ